MLRDMRRCREYNMACIVLLLLCQDPACLMLDSLAKPPGFHSRFKCNFL